MGIKTITITAANGANPDNPNVYRNSANGDNQIKFMSGGGTQTVSNLPAIFTTAPGTLSLTPGNPVTLTIKTDATDGEHSYSVSSGSGLPGDGKSPQINVNP